MSGKLYVVGTPIGNLEDFSPRAERILSEVDFIAAEDTRVTLKLLNHFDIKCELIAYYEHNKGEKENYIINRLLSGESCAAALRKRSSLPVRGGSIKRTLIFSSVRAAAFFSM